CRGSLGGFVSAGARSSRCVTPFWSHFSSADWCERRRCVPAIFGVRVAPARDEPRSGDPPPLKWSDLRYVFDIKEDCNGKEALQARRDRREAAPGRCSSLAGPGHDGGDPADRCERGDLLSLASRVWRAED